MSNFLQVNGRNIHYVETGKPDGPPLLLLHGQSGFWYDWIEVLPGLIDQYRVVLLDHPGFGDSDWDPTGNAYLVPGFCKDLEQVIEQLHLNKFVIAGHSFGGRIGIYYACLHPEQVRAVIMADSAPDVDPIGSILARIYLSSIPSSFKSFEHAMTFFRAHYPNLTDVQLSDRLKRYLKADSADKFVVKRDPLIGDKYRGMLDGSIPSPRPDWDSLKNIRCPLLLLLGDRSELVSPAIVQEMLRINPRMEVVEIKNATHLICTEQPEQVLKAMQHYLGNLAV
jgi:esterase